MSSPLDAQALLGQALVRRRAYRAWRRYILIALAIGLIYPAQRLLWLVGVQLRATSQIELLGGKVDYRIDATNWRLGGESSVAFRPATIWAVRTTPVSDIANIAHLHRVTSVELTEFDRAGLTDFRFLCQLPELNSIHMNRDKPLYWDGRFPEPFPGNSIAGLESLPELKTLEVAGNEITDEDLLPLIKAGRLESLDLGHTRITDKTLKRIPQLRSLGLLRLTGSRVTAEGVSALRQLQPALEIEYDPNVKPIHPE